MSTIDGCGVLRWAALFGFLLFSGVAIDAEAAPEAGGVPGALKAAVSEFSAKSQMEQAPRTVPEGRFTHEECLRCHAEQDPALVTQWRNGPHGKTAVCTACHGDRHGDLPAARQDAACTGCHGGAVAHSYVTSKHGVLVRLGRPDWTLPLRRGNYRFPGCAYCHFHDRDHADTMDPARGSAVREWVCSACHAPRYVADQLAAGDRLQAIARLKVREAEELTAHHPEGAAAVRDHLESTERHLANVRLGAGHQSPDYQWWHGQPALDGDLIRLRHAVAHTMRQPTVSFPVPASSGDAEPEDARPGRVRVAHE